MSATSVYHCAVLFSSRAAVEELIISDRSASDSLIRGGH